MNAPVTVDRRSVLAGGGALIVSFSIGNAFAGNRMRRGLRRLQNRQAV